MEYEKAYNDLIARINEVKEKPRLCMKDKHHYNGYVETGIRDALDYIVSPESEDERIRNDIMEAVENWFPNERVEEIRFYLSRQKEYIEDIRQYAYNKGLVDAEEKQKSAEWSEEDEKMLDVCSQYLGNTITADYDEEETTIKDCRNWLLSRFKSLCPQPHWKPSEQ